MTPLFTGYTDGASFGPTNQLKINLVLWLDEAFINHGFFRRLPASGESDYSGNILTQLKPVTDGSYPSGTYWQSRTHNWVYESGLSIQSSLMVPFRPSGIYVKKPEDSAFTYYASGSSNGNYNYKFDFKNGAVYFLNQNIVPVASTILCPHTYKEIHVDLSDNDKFVELVSSDTKNQVPGSGVAYPNITNVQMPAVFIEHTGRDSSPLELGGNKIYHDNVIFHVFADNETDRDQLVDMFDSLKYKTIQLVNFNTAPLPLDDYGDINPAYPNLDTLQNQYKYKLCYFSEVRSQKFKSTAGYHRGYITNIIEMRNFN